MIRDVATPLLSVAAPGGLPITPCIEVRSQSGESDCSGIATREYRAFRNAAIPFSGGGSSEQESDGRSRPYRCHHPRKRMIQYSTERSFKPRGRGVLDTHLRGYDSRLLIAEHDSYTLVAQLQALLQRQRLRRSVEPHLDGLG